MGKQTRPTEQRTAKHQIPLWLIALGVLAALLPAVTGAVYLPKDIEALWGYATADKCPPGAPADDCLLSLPGMAGDPFVIEGSGNSLDAAQVSITIAKEARTSDVIPSFVHIDIRPGEADDLGLTDAQEVPVTVTLYRGEAMEITGPTGETVTKNDPPTVRFTFLFAFSVICALATVAGVIYLWRRLRRYGLAARLPDTGKEPPVPMPRWLLPAGLCLVAGLVAAVLLGWLSVLVVSDALLVPVVLGGTAVGSAVLGVYYWRLARRDRSADGADGVGHRVQHPGS